MNNYFQAELYTDGIYWGANIIKNANNRKNAINEIARLKRENKQLREALEEAQEEPVEPSNNIVVSFSQASVTTSMENPDWSSSDEYGIIVGFVKLSEENTARPLIYMASGSTITLCTTSEPHSSNCVTLMGLHVSGTNMTIQNNTGQSIINIVIYK